VDPAAVAHDMGLPEGTIRSWLGHLRKSGYLQAERLNGGIRVTVKRVEIPTPGVESVMPHGRAFTAAKLARALGEAGEREALQAALNFYPDSVVRRALAGALRVPDDKIRRSRTALFLYLLRHHTNDET
jgi:hypothetical protein